MAQDIKQLFFAQYYGLQIHRSTKDNKAAYVGIGGSIDNLKSTDYLLLKPLSIMSVVDALKVAEEINAFSFAKSKRWVVEHIDNQDASYIQITSKNSYHKFEIDYDGHLHFLDTETGELPTLGFPDYLAGFDLIRRLGYALPYRGISVEQQLVLGWIKLIE